MQRSHRVMINDKVSKEISEEPGPAHLVPGVSNTQAHFKKLDTQRRERETEAALVIQAHYRGHKGRKQFKKRQGLERQRVELEYEQLNRELKTDSQYNLKSYLAEKKRLRDKMGMVDSESVEQIVEAIGESGSVASHRLRKGATQHQNFFRVDSSKSSALGKDPLSLIAIFAKRNGTVPELAKDRKLRPDKSHSKERAVRAPKASK